MNSGSDTLKCHGLASSACGYVSSYGLRNRLIHAYDSINLDIIWAIVTTDLPDLIEQLERILDEGSA